MMPSKSFAKKISARYVEIYTRNGSVYVPVEDCVALSQDLRRIVEEEATRERESAHSSPAMIDEPNDSNQ